MTSDNVESQAVPGRLTCPACGQKGKAVKPITVQSLLTDKATAGASRTDGFRFCAEPACDVAYFHPETGERFARTDVRVRIGQKETEPPRPICYCFNHTIEEIETEVAATGTSRIPEEIAAKCRQGLDRCEETNPRGSCCLGTVRRALKEAQAGLHAADTENPSSETAAEDAPESCAARAPGEETGGGGIRSGLAVLPGVALSLLPAVACPACWPAYFGVLASLGFGFLANATYLLPLTVFFMLVAVGMLGLRAKRRRSYGPFALGGAAAAIIVVGKFVLGVDAAVYGGAALLVGASIWNAWPRKAARDVPCPACVPAWASEGDGNT